MEGIDYRRGRYQGTVFYFLLSMQRKFREAYAIWVELQHCVMFIYTVLLTADDRTPRKTKNDDVLNIPLIKTLF
jgi:hypothetical protein